MILVGELSLWVALLMAAWATVVSFSGGLQARADLIESGERALLATGAFLLLATTGVWTALLSHDFSLRFVAAHTSANLPTAYCIAALWAGKEGALLCAALLVSGYASIAVVANRRRDQAMTSWAHGTLGAFCLFLLGVVCFGANPYARLGMTLADGSGMHPQLQTAAMVLQPPLLALGLTATVVPFAMGIGGLMARRPEYEWLPSVRRWTLWSWFCITGGLLLGMWWAQSEPAWGGIWRWDVAESASLLAWLTSAAVLHNLLLHEKRGMSRRGTIVLTMCSMLVALLATFVTRSALVQAQGGPLSLLTTDPMLRWLLGAQFVTVVLTVALLRARRDELRSLERVERAMSREGALRSGNVLLAAIGAATLCATIAPLLAPASDGLQSGGTAALLRTVGGVLALALLALVGVGPLLAWRGSASRELSRALRWPLTSGVIAGSALLLAGVRDGLAVGTIAFAGMAAASVVQEIVLGVGARRRLFGEALLVAFSRLWLQQHRRYGGYVAHVGLIACCCGLAGQLFARDIAATVKAGDTIKVTDPYGRAWSLSSLGVSRFEELNRRVLAVSFTAVRDGKKLGVLSSESRQYFDGDGQPTYEPSTEVGILRARAQDVSLIFTGAQDDESTVVRIRFEPLMWWLWLGGILMALGGVIVMLPDSQRERVR